MTHARARGAMLLLFDVAADAVDEHDDWHTHEHMPERLAIPGFIRGSRWTRDIAGPRYCVLYEVADLAVLDSPAYRARLDDPTPWTTRMMPRYVGMRRSLCEIVAGDGDGLGGSCLVVSFAPAPIDFPTCASGCSARCYPAWPIGAESPRGACSTTRCRQA